MSVRPIALMVATMTLAACSPQTAPAPTAGPAQGNTPERAIRRDIPMTNRIRRAHAMATRDSSGRPGRNYWQQQVDYTIHARLDAPTSTITGRGTITLHNNSGSALGEIKLRLDQNYFAPNAARISTLPRSIEITQGMTVSRMAVNGQRVILNPLLAAATETPGAPVASGLDQTVATITLQDSIPAKSSATVEVEWSFKVPAVQGSRGQRMGRLADTLYQVAQWYPRVTVYDDLRGWDTDPYLGNSEFYNEFGKWDVSIDVPAGWLVGATGVLQNADAVLSPVTRERLSHVLESNETRTIVGANEMGAGRATAAGDRLVWRFVADTVNDFAWATSRSYVWQATRATIPGRGPVPVHLFFLPGDTTIYQQVPDLARHALEFYSRLWMPYAFPQLTLVDGSELGMEYPMFIMSAAGAADHETGHEWWPMTVSNNETWYGWMDEGFNQYMNILSAADRRGQPAVLDGPGLDYGLVSGDENESPMMWDANYASARYGFTTYSKAPMMLSMLGAIVGDSAVQRAMSQYAHAWRFKHPSPWDYMFFMNNALGRADLGWFWYYWLFTTEAVQQSIVSVSPASTLDASGNQLVVVRQDGQMPAPIVLLIEYPEGGGAPAMTNSMMVGKNAYLVTLPVDVWFGGSKSFTARIRSSRPFVKVTLDPYRRFPDANAKDNVWPR